MATTTITATQIAFGTEQAVTEGVTGTALTASYVYEIAYPKNGKLLVWVDADATTVATVSASDFACASGLGSYDWTISIGTQAIAMFDSSRHQVIDGTNVDGGCLQLTFDGAAAGRIAAFYVPDGA